MAITAFLSRSHGLLNRGPGRPASLGTCSSFQHLLSNWSDLQLIWTPTAQSGVLRAPSAGFLVFSTASYLQLPDFQSSLGLYNCSISTFFLWASQFALNSTRPRSRLYPDIPRPDTPITYIVSIRILTAWLGSICYRINFLAQS